MSRTVDILCFNSIKAINGPVVIHRSILKHTDYFRGRGYSISVVLKEGIFTSEYQPTETVENTLFIKSAIQKVAGILKNAILTFFQAHYFLRILSFNFFDYKIKRNIKNYLRLERNPDIVITDSEKEMYYFLRYNRSNSRTIMFLHNDGVPLKMMFVSDPKLEGSGYYKKMKSRYEYTIQHVDKIAFICNTGKNNFLQSYPAYKPGKLSVVVNGIEEREAPVSKTVDTDVKQFRYNLCCIGTLTHRKGQEIILQALSQIDKRVLQNIHVSIVGDGPVRKSLGNFIRDHNLSGNVELTGSIDNSKVDEYLSNASIFILMSRNEGLPISIIEAMRAGLPVISTKISGIPELVENEINGILLDPDANQLSDLLNRVDQYDWEVMGKASRQMFKEKFTVQRVFTEYCDMYDAMLV